MIALSGTMWILPLKDEWPRQSSGQADVLDLLLDLSLDQLDIAERRGHDRTYRR
jgi:hypothetical protein